MTTPKKQIISCPSCGQLNGGHSQLCTFNFKQSNDPVNHPTHYTQGKVECIDAIEAATCNLPGIEAVCTGAAIKYLWRWKQKNGLEDLLKAQWYMYKLILLQTQGESRPIDK
jgi:hypothetical protein